jgi:hypothetical protein
MRRVQPYGAGGSGSEASRPGPVLCSPERPSEECAVAWLPADPRDPIEPIADAHAAVGAAGERALAER